MEEIVKHPLESVQRIAADNRSSESTSYRILCKALIFVQNSTPSDKQVKVSAITPVISEQRNTSRVS